MSHLCCFLLSHSPADSYFHRHRSIASFHRSQDRAAAWALPVSASFLRTVVAFGTLYVRWRWELIVDEQADDVAVDSFAVISICELCLARNRNFPRPRKKSGKKF